MRRGGEPGLGTQASAPSNKLRRNDREDQLVADGARTASLPVLTIPCVRLCVYGAIYREVGEGGLTESAFAKESARLGARGRRRGVLELRGLEGRSQ